MLYIVYILGWIIKENNNNKSIFINISESQRDLFEGDIVGDVSKLLNHFIKSVFVLVWFWFSFWMFN